MFKKIPGRKLSNPSAPRYGSKKIIDVVGQIDRKILNINPLYQRNLGLKKITEKSGILDSINMNIPIGAIELAQRKDSIDINTVDGKQRLTTIYEFVKNQTPYIDFDSRILYYFSEVPETLPNGFKKYSAEVLTELEQHKFLQTDIVIIETSDTTLESEVEMFRRNQLCKTLSPGEMIKADITPSGTFASELYEIFHKHFVALFGNNEDAHYVKRDTGRYICYVLVAIVSGLKLKNFTLTHIAKELGKSQTTVDEDFKKKCRRILEIHESLRTHIYDTGKIPGMSKTIILILITIDHFFDKDIDVVAGECLNLVAKIGPKCSIRLDSHTYDWLNDEVWIRTPPKEDWKDILQPIDLNDTEEESPAKRRKIDQ